MARKDFREILTIFREKEFHGVKFAITTNGLLIHRYFDDLMSTDVMNMNLSIDSLVAEKFAFMARQPLKSVERVFDNFDNILMQNTDRLNLKINVVLMKNFNDDEIPVFCEIAKNNSIELRFLEYMPFDGNHWSLAKV